MKTNKLLCLVTTLCCLAGCAEKEAQVEVSSVSLNTATIEMVEGETFSLVATVLPKDAEYDGVTWASSNASVASVNSGTVTAIKEGTTTITASAGGKSSTCTVKVSTKVVAVTSITLDKTSLSMQVGETETITATVNPENATDKSVTWSSSDVSVATVADGKITAKKSGEATVAAKSGSCIAECTVTISVYVESVALDKTALSLAVGETSMLTVTVKPDDATDKNVSWTSSDESVAKIDNGKVTAVKAGKATIIAECGGKTAECAVTVTVPIGSVTLDKTSLSLAVGETAQLTAIVKPDDATDKNVVWTSSDESVAKVDNGKVTAIKSGTATVTAKCGDKIAECVVTITVPIRNVSLDKTSLLLAVGETVQLTATVKPDDATDKNVAWSSSDESVAKVDNGKVTAVKSGKAMIKAKCGDITVECMVVVIQADNIIYYTSTDGRVVSPYNETAFGANIVSNEYLDGIGRITFDGSVTSIGKTAFMGCTKISLMRIPNTISSIGASAFSGCESLETINTPKNLSIIGPSAFENCRRLLSYTLPNGITKIEDKTFCMCNELVIDGIPSSVKMIGNEAFVWNYALEKLVLPYGVRTIGHQAFWGAGIKELMLPESITSIGYWGFSSIKIEKLTIPGSLVVIEQGMFSSDCLSEIIIKEGVTTIGPKAFADNKRLKTVDFPTTIENIYTQIFDNCVSFSDLYIRAKTPPMTYSGLPDSVQIQTTSVFGDNIDFNIWVPKESVDVYKSNWQWKKYKDNIRGYDF